MEAIAKLRHELSREALKNDQFTAQSARREFVVDAFENLLDGVRRKIEAALSSGDEADFSFLSEPLRTCSVTHHGIERMPEIIERVLAVPGFHRCVHIEPVGWQIPINNWLDGSAFTQQMIKIDKANKKFSLKENQNSNLYPLLRRLELEGRIQIYSVRKYLCSHLINNATTLISWGPPSDT